MKILLADDHGLMLAGARHTLESAGFDVIGEANSGPEVLPLVNTKSPDVVLLDLRMPGIDETVARSAGLAERELEILKAVARGVSNKAIAADLWITVQTVKFHLTNIYRKLGISNRTEATSWALGKGLNDESEMLL